MALVNSFVLGILTWTATWCTITSEDYFLLKANVQKQNTCITNSSAALAFIPPLESFDSYSGVASSFYPNKISNINCGLNRDDPCYQLWVSEKWRLQDSIIGNISQLITDWRWEELPIFKVNSTCGKSEGDLAMVNHPLLNVNKDRFRVPFSILTRSELYIFLCDAKNITASECYCIVLEEEKYALKMCHPSYGKETFKNFCGKTLRTGTSPGKLLAQERWTHFQISIDANTLTLSNTKGSLFTYTTSKTSFSPKYISFGGKCGEMLLRIHNYSFAYCESETRQQLGPSVIDIPAGTNCISMFILTCKKCYLTFELEKQVDCRLNPAIFGPFNTENEKWTQIKLHFENSVRCTSRLYVNTQAEEPHGTFWAIDHVRECSKEEYRYLKLSGSNWPCQLVSNNVKDIITEDTQRVEETDLYCPEDTFGSNCIPCKIFGASNVYCSNFKYCEVFGGSSMVCRCTAGYTNHNCDSRCPVNQYGHSCKNSCSVKCNITSLIGCRYSDGMCQNNCLDQYNGKKCDIGPEGTLVEPPKVIEEETTTSTCKIRINSFTRNKMGGNIPEYIKIQYKEALKGELWKDAFNSKFYTVPDVTIRNLKHNTEYYIRGILYSERNPYVYTNDNNEIKYSTCKTTCKDIEWNDITIVPKHNSATVSFELGPLSCDIHEYNLGLNGTLGSRGFINANPLKILSLNNSKIEPCETYDFSIFRVGSSSRIKKKFKTTIGVAYPITGTIITKESTTQVLLKWETKTYSCGETQFRVQYWRKRGKMCQNSTRGPEAIVTRHTKELQYRFEDLKPYSVYEVEITGITSAGSSPVYSRKVETLPTRQLNDDELIDHHVDITTTDTTIIFSIHIDCDRIQGGITMMITAKCVTDWCSSHAPAEPVQYQYEVGTEYVLNELSPYVNYKVSINVRRTNGNTRIRELFLPNSVPQGTVRTKPTVPGNIEDFLAFSKDENFISLRWKPPYPPKGVLKAYRICYTNLHTGREFREELEPSYCKVWPKYHCVTIKKNILPNNRYHLQLWATNENPYKYVPVHQHQLEVSAELGTPNPPINVSSSWSAEETLVVKWQHPIITNGRIERFRITLECGGSVKGLERSLTDMENYNMTYKYQIEESELPKGIWCSKCTLNVATANRLFSSQSATSLFYFPPPHPNTTTKEKLEEERTNSTITVYLPKLEKSENIQTGLTVTAYLLISRVSDGRVFEKLQEFEKTLRRFGTISSTDYLKLLFKKEGSEVPSVIYIGDFSQNMSHYRYHVDSKEEYGIHLFYVNQCQDMVRIYRMDAGKAVTRKKKSSLGNANELYLLVLLLLLLIPLAVFIYLRKRKGARASSTHCFRKSSMGAHSDIIPLAEKTPPILVKNPKIETYENSRFVPKTVHSKPIRLGEYESYLRNAIQEGELEKQHGLFSGTQTKPSEYGSSAPNKSKNRYKNLIAYDHTRVKLTKIPVDEYSDYINANFIDGYKSPKSYIATQGPKSSTLNDFWRMIWQYKVENIVMLANIFEGGKKKVEQYWPNFNEERDFDGIKVQFINSKVFADYEYRVFNVTKENEERKVQQIHFTSWPDHGVPLYPQSLVPFLQRMLKIAHSAIHPVVVHCSAGVGRTGTVILSDICLRMAAGEGCIDFLANLELLRTQRPNMVDNIEQYKLAHLVVLECLFGMTSSIDCDDKMQMTVDSLIASGGVSKYMEYLEETRWEDAAMDTVWNVDDAPPVNPDKDRFKDIVPAPYHRVFLLRYPPEDEASSYINAAIVDGFRSPGRYIVTQQPMPNTLGDFWRLVNEKKCRVVISLNAIDTRDRSSCQFLPKIGGVIRPVEYLTVRHVNTTVRDVFNRVNVKVVDEIEDEEMTVAVISMRNWMPGELLPESMKDFLTFWEESYLISTKASPVLITCYDGVTASGLYIAMSFIIEKMKLEHVCDVCLAVRSIRHSRPQFVTTEEQFEFLYKASLMYIQGFEPYANFS